MTKLFDEIVKTALIEKLYLSNNVQEIEELVKKITRALILKENLFRKYTDQELFLREDPNSCHYFPYKFDLISNHLICRQEFDELSHQVQENLTFSSHTDFLLCLKDNLRDYAFSRLYQLFQEYYSIVTLDESKYAKNFLNDLLDTHDHLCADMEKIDIMLGEEQQSSYKFYTLYPTSNLLKKSRVFCLHIKTFINFPEKIFICRDGNYLHFKEQVQPVAKYMTRKSMIVKCLQCGEAYHQDKNKHSNVGSYEAEFYFSKSLY